MTEINKYQNGKIYKIVCNKTNLVYIGSTIENYLSNRLKGHKCCFNRNKGITTANQILENGDYYIELVELFPCNSKDELLVRERYYYDNIECVNKMRPKITLEENKESKKKSYLNYRSNNKDKIKKDNKEYYEENKDIILVKQKIYVENNKEKIKEQKKHYREEHKEQLKEKKQKYQDENKEKIKEQRKKYREENKEKIKEQKKISYQRNKK